VEPSDLRMSFREVAHHRNRARRPISRSRIRSDSSGICTFESGQSSSRPLTSADLHQLSVGGGVRHDAPLDALLHTHNPAAGGGLACQASRS